MDPLDAAVAALGEAGEPLHWTVLQDRALRAGAIDPFTDRDVRRTMREALARGLGDGRLIRVAKGTYGLSGRDVPTGDGGSEEGDEP